MPSGPAGRPWIPPVLLAAAIGCGEAGEVDSPRDGGFPETARVSTDRGELLLAGGRLEVIGGPAAGTLATGVVGRPAFTRDRVVAAVDEGRAEGQLLVFTWDPGSRSWRPEVLLDAGGRPDRVSLSPGGEVVAFVWGRTGLASVYTVATDGGSAPVQRTNVGLESARRRPGGAPAAYVPPPEREGGLRFNGDRLEWDAAGRAWSVPWR